MALLRRVFDCAPESITRVALSAATAQPLVHYYRQQCVRRFCDLSAKRVIGAIAHINSGKTTTSEAMLYAAGALQRMGNVDAGDTALDFLPAERERGITINAAAVAFEWRDHRFFLVDSPGHLDFTYEVERALRVMDGVVVLLDAVAGVQPQTETVWRQADRNGLARIIFINKMDRDGASFESTVQAVKHRFGALPAVLQLPLWKKPGGLFSGAMDVISLEAVEKAADDSLCERAPVRTALSGEVLSIAKKAREMLVETLAEVDDDVMALWVDGAPVGSQVLRRAIRSACISGKVTPVLCGSSLRNIGVQPLMDAAVDYLPSPLERAPVISESGGDAALAIPLMASAPLLAYAFKVTHDTHRGRLVYLRAFAGGLKESRTPFFNTTKKKKEMPTKLLRVLADDFLELDTVNMGDIFAAVGLKHTETGDTLQVLDDRQGVEHVVLPCVRTPPVVFSVAVEVDSASQEKQLDAALEKLIAEDSSLRVTRDELTGETLLSGMGELHLEVVHENLSQAMRFPVRVSRPRIAYRETVTRAVTHLEHYDSTFGSTRLAASLSVSVSPHNENENTVIVVSDGAEYEFTAVHQKAIREGVVAALGRGPLLGYATSNVAVTVRPASGGIKATDSTLAALQACASKATAAAMRSADPALLEPMMQVQCIVPESVAGDVISELSHPVQRRGIIEGVEREAREGCAVEFATSRIDALVPLQGMLGWATRIRSTTKGRGDFTMNFASYKPVSAATQEKLLAVARGFS